MGLNDTMYNPEGKQRIQTETGTFRIKQDVMDELHRESKQKKESLNVVINKILNFYVNDYVPLCKAGYIPFSKGFLTRIFDMLTDEQVVKLAQDYVKYEFKEQMQMLRQECTLSTYIEALCSWCDASGFPYRHDNDKTNNTDIYTIRFDIGTKYSFFIGKYIQLIHEYFEDKNSEVEVTNNTVIFKFQRS
jgi:hypothetical protein